MVVVCFVRLLRPPHVAWAFLTRGTKLFWGCEADLLRLKRAVFWGVGVRQLPGLKPRLRFLSSAAIELCILLFMC